MRWPWTKDEPQEREFSNHEQRSMPVWEEIKATQWVEHLQELGESKEQIKDRLTKYGIEVDHLLAYTTMDE
jgi:hypothetical protein